MSSYMTDVGNVINKSSTIPEVKNSTSRKQNPGELDMMDFLNLMVVQLQSQTIDNTMDTSDMLNQLVQMQMISALTNMTDASVMSYASSLVGKEVTIGDYSTGELVEKVVTITGSGLSNGKQVLFAGNEVYDLSSVMAVGRLPEIEDEDGEGGDKVDGADKTDLADKTDPSDKTDATDKTDPSDKTEDAGKKMGVLTEAERKELIEMLREHNIEVSEEISNADLIKAVNEIMNSGVKDETETETGTETQTEDLTEARRAELMQYLMDHQVEVEDGITDAELIEAVKKLEESMEMT